MSCNQVKLTCETCSLDFDSGLELIVHESTLTHHIKLESKLGVSCHHCAVCKLDCPTLSIFSKHTDSEEHLQNLHLQRLHSSEATESFYVGSPLTVSSIMNPSTCVVPSIAPFCRDSEFWLKGNAQTMEMQCSGRLLRLPPEFDPTRPPPPLPANVLATVPSLNSYRRRPPLLKTPPPPPGEPSKTSPTQANPVSCSLKRKPPVYVATEGILDAVDPINVQNLKPRVSNFTVTKSSKMRQLERLLKHSERTTAKTVADIIERQSSSSAAITASESLMTTTVCSSSSSLVDNPRLDIPKLPKRLANSRVDRSRDIQARLLAYRTTVNASGSETGPSVDEGFFTDVLANELDIPKLPKRLAKLRVDRSRDIQARLLAYRTVSQTVYANNSETVPSSDEDFCTEILVNEPAGSLDIEILETVSEEKCGVINKSGFQEESKAKRKKSKKSRLSEPVAAGPEVPINSLKTCKVVLERLSPSKKTDVNSTNCLQSSEVSKTNKQTNKLNSTVASFAVDILNESLRCSGESFEAANNINVTEVVAKSEVTDDGAMVISSISQNSQVPQVPCESSENISASHKLWNICKDEEIEDAWIEKLEAEINYCKEALRLRVEALEQHKKRRLELRCERRSLLFDGVCQMPASTSTNVALATQEQSVHVQPSPALKVTYLGVMAPNATSIS